MRKYVFAGSAEDEKEDPLWWWRDLECAYIIAMSVGLEVSSWPTDSSEAIDDGAFEQIYAVFSGWTDPPIRTS